MEGMRQALLAAYQGLKKGEVPVGCALYLGQTLIAASHNQVEACGSIVGHCEMVVLYQASQRLNSKYLWGADLYVTLEPCPMCAYAIAHSKVKRLFFGAYNPKNGAIDHHVFLYQRMPHLFQTEVVGGVLEPQCQAPLDQFFQQSR